MENLGIFIIYIQNNIFQNFGQCLEVHIMFAYGPWFIYNSVDRFFLQWWRKNSGLVLEDPTH